MGGFGGNAIPVVKKSVPIVSKKSSNNSTVCQGFYYVRRNINKTRNQPVAPMFPTSFLISHGEETKKKL